jgi:predicted transcriptional regulator of viral defense system
MTMNQREKALDLLKRRAFVRPKDLAEHGMSRDVLRPLVKYGQVIRVARGLYALPDADITENSSLAEVSKKVPHGVVCLLSALRFHGLGTQNPYEVWLAIDRKARRPSGGHLPIRIVRFSGKSLGDGVEVEDIQGVSVRIYSTAKTVADCFKYRNKIGLDVALEALREGWRARRFNMDDLWRYAKVDRVTNVMRPYLEALE